jgi:hypothetical protein
MKNLLQLQTVMIAGLILGMMSSWRSAVAVTFNQQEVDQNKFIAIAVPLAQSNYYNLLILEQLSNARPCWSEAGTNPVSVTPLLLGFDFTKICSRSTDSNGYSIRQAGQDLDLRYDLRIVRRGEDLALIGTPYNAPGAPVMEIGRTHGISSGFIKIILEPGWRFTKRSFNGKLLGHIYLTQDLAPPGAENSPRLASTALPRPKVFVPPTGAIEIPVPAPASRIQPVKPAIQSPTGSANSPSSVSAARALPAPKPPGPQPGAIEIPVPILRSSPPTTSAVTPQPELLSRSVNNPSLSSSNNVLRVPAGNIPMGNPGDMPTIYVSGSPLSSGVGSPPPPPLQSGMLGPRYRVVVETGDTSQQAQIRTLVPGAFRSSYQGRAVVQVGSFKERSKADEMLQIMNSNGFNAVIDAIQ